MKFPAGQITLWGIVILVGVQLYFFLYLKQLWGKLGPADAGWDVPWIGMDTSLWAQVIFFFSIVMVPCIAVALLGGHTISQLEKPIIWSPWAVARKLGFIPAFTPIAKIAGLSTGFILALLFAIRSWKYRPKLPPELLKVNVEETSSKSESPSSERQPVGPSDREMARVEYDAELERQGSVVGIVALVALIGFTVWLVKSEEGNSPP